MAYGWEGESIRLVPLEKAKHLDNAMNWINDPVVTEWLLVGDFPMTRLAEEEFFDRMMKPQEREVSFAVETLEGEHIGFSGIHSIDFRHGFCETGSFIGKPQIWGKGFGTDSARTRSKYCFEVLGLRMLLSGCLEGNEGSRRMQEKVGYVQYGFLPDHYWKRGAYRGHVLSYLSRERWHMLEGSK